MRGQIVVVVDEAALFEVEGIAPAAIPHGKQDAFYAAGWEFDLRSDAVGAVADVGGDIARNAAGAGIEDPVSPFSRVVGIAAGPAAPAIVEGEDAVARGFGRPGIDQLAELVVLFLGVVGAFAEIGVEVVELPAVLGEG